MWKLPENQTENVYESSHANAITQRPPAFHSRQMQKN